MSDPFQKVMRDLNTLLKETYNARKVAIIPGSGTFGMEAVARQFATDQHVMVVRNGWFSFRWTEIFDMGGAGHSIPKSHTVLKAQPQSKQNPSDDNNEHEHEHEHVQFAPYPIEDVERKIMEERPKVFFAPHVETSTGMILPDSYIKRVSTAMHKVGGLMVLDCIASGTVWVDMKETGVDVVISAPQKGWTGPACAALVMMSERALETMQETEETSFSVSLKRWSAIMDTYEKGGFGYHTTMPTDGLRDFHEISVETMKFGIPELKAAQLALGDQTHVMLKSKGLTPVAADGYQAPGVLVYYSPTGIENPAMMMKFKDNGLQIAMGVPWRIDEPEGLKTFRLGLFGLDKMGNIDETVDTLEGALDNVLSKCGHEVPAEVA
jgi:alanine-glyoxylate transaminase/serine-glyoxylate transaminase/serine-pyruvate transaminase